MVEQGNDSCCSGWLSFHYLFIFSPHFLCSHLNTWISSLCHTDCILRGRGLSRDSWGDYKYVLYIFASSPVPLAAATGGPRYRGNQSLTVNVVPGRAKCYPSSSYSLPGARRRCPGLPRLCTIRTWQTARLVSLLHLTQTQKSRSFENGINEMVVWD